MAQAAQIEVSFTGSTDRRPEFLTLATGVTLEYVAHGTGRGMPVIFLHGVTDSWRSFEGVLANLPPSVRAYALSLRGHGNSSRPAAGYLYEDMARDVNAFMDALYLPAAIVVGHSMGSMVAAQFAAGHPERVAGLVLMGSWATLEGHPVMKEFVDSEVSTLTDPIDPAFVREFQMSTLARGIPPEVLEVAVNESLKVPDRVWRAAFEGFLREGCSPDLTAITAPTLIAWGDRDVYSQKSDQDVLLAALPGARVLTYEGAGHAFHWEDPPAFAADLMAFYFERSELAQVAFCRK